MLDKLIQSKIWYLNFQIFKNAREKLKLVSLDNLILNQVNTQKIANKNAEFKLKIKPKKINISCDFNQINRLFMNILKNSIESNSKKKKSSHNSFKKIKFF